MFTNDDKQLICQGLTMRKNVIQTGSHLLSAKDVERMSPDLALEHGAKIVALDENQMRLILTIDALIHKVLNS